MRQSIALISVAIALAGTLTLSHALLRAAASHSYFDIGWLLRVGGALILYALVFFAYSFVLKYFDLSILYPAYTGLSILGVVVVGVIYFGEQLTGLKIVGVLSIVFGVALIAT